MQVKIIVTIEENGKGLEIGLGAEAEKVAEAKR